MKNQEALENYILSTHFPNFTALDDVSVYGAGVKPGWALARDVVATATVDALSGKMQYSRTQPRSKYEGIDADLSRIVVRVCRLKYAKNTTDSHVALRLNYVPRQFKEGQRDIDAIVGAISSATKVPFSFALVRAHTDEPHQAVAVCEVPEFLESQKAFVHTMALINEQNLRNGIIEIPHQVCIDAGLNMRPTVRTPENAKTKLEFNSYFAIPPDHVCAWVLRLTDSQRRRHGVYAEELVLGSGRMIYYLVGDACFHAIYQDCSHNWLNSVDTRPLSSINVEFHPFDASQPLDAQHNVELTLDMVYTTFPQSIPPEVLASLAPTLEPNFPLFTNSLRCRQIREYDRAQSEIQALKEEAI